MSERLSEEERARREARKFGTDSPHEPTDEFIVQAFAEGARSLWPDSRDPGWHVTFNRWLAAREKSLREALGRVEALAEEWERSTWGRASSKRLCAADLRAALAVPTPAAPVPDASGEG